jgi:hypothetical protein
MSSPWISGRPTLSHRAPGAEEILKLMDVVVTGDEVKRGKPQRLGEGLVPRGKHGKTTSVTGEHGGTIGSVMSWGNPLVGLVLLLFAIGVGVCTRKPKIYFLQLYTGSLVVISEIGHGYQDYQVNYYIVIWSAMGVI